MPRDILDALSQRYEGEDFLGAIFTTLETPTHLITAALDPKRDYLSSLARGVDPSELAGLKGIGGTALDLVADPLNLLVGAGLISKLAKAGKFSKAAKAARPLERLAKDTAEEVPDLLKRGPLENIEQVTE